MFRYRTVAALVIGAVYVSAGLLGYFGANSALSGFNDTAGDIGGFGGGFLDFIKALGASETGDKSGLLQILRVTGIALAVIGGLVVFEAVYRAVRGAEEGEG